MIPPGTPHAMRPLAPNVTCRCPRVREIGGIAHCCQPAARRSDGSTASGIKPSV